MSPSSCSNALVPVTQVSMSLGVIRRSSTYWIKVTSGYLTRYWLKSSCSTLSKITREFLKPWCNHVHDCSLLISISGSCHSKEKYIWSFGIKERLKKVSLSPKQCTIHSLGGGCLIRYRGWVWWGGYQLPVCWPLGGLAPGGNHLSLDFWQTTMGYSM